jgi:hypothetical protein
MPLHSLHFTSLRHFNTERCSRLGASVHLRHTSEERMFRSRWYMHCERSASERRNFDDKLFAGPEAAAVPSGTVEQGSGAEAE